MYREATGYPGRQTSFHPRINLADQVLMADAPQINHCPSFYYLSNDFIPYPVSVDGFLYKPL